MPTITLDAGDGHQFSAYEAVPAGTPRGGLVVVQEIFGVNAHIRHVADGYAADGYRVIAPAIFDRAERGVELDYDRENAQRGMALRQKIGIEEMLGDIEACVAALKPAGKVGIVGYCLGGSLAWLAATRIAGLSAAVGYYGGMIAKHLDETAEMPGHAAFRRGGWQYHARRRRRHPRRGRSGHAGVHLCRRRPRLQPRGQPRPPPAFGESGPRAQPRVSAPAPRLAESDRNCAIAANSVRSGQWFLDLLMVDWRPRSHERRQAWNDPGRFLHMKWKSRFNDLGGSSSFRQRLKLRSSPKPARRVAGA